MSRFFIDRPIFAWVISIVIMLTGALAITQLPLEQYPDIAPTSIAVTTTYTGASAQTVEDSVTQVIEQRMQGLDGLQSMSSESTSAGRSRVSLSFVAGTDADVAQMQVQNKVQLALTPAARVGAGPGRDGDQVGHRLPDDPDPDLRRPHRGLGGHR